MLKKVGQVAYKLRLLKSTKMYLVFHVSQLKKQLGITVNTQPLPIGLSEEEELMVTPKKIMQHKYSTQGELALLIK